MRQTADRTRLGAALKTLRLQKGWTLAEVSRRTGLSVPTLSKVENDKLSLTYDKLIRVSEGMEVDISQLFAPVHTPASITGRRSVNKLGDGDLIATRTYNYRYLSSDVTRKKFIPTVTEILTSSIEEFGELLRHGGEEFIYVLEGKLEVHTELYAPIVLSPGESVYLDSTMGHAYVAHGPGPCRILGICSAGENELREVSQQCGIQAATPSSRGRAKHPKRVARRR